MIASLFVKLLHLGSLVTVILAGQDEFTIVRSSTRSLPDKFIVPASQCGPSSPTCPLLYSGAVNHDPTQCKCACRYEDSTFGFNNGGWICMKNSKVRQKSGCRFMFDGETNSKPLEVMAEGSHDRVILPSFSCTLDHSASFYLRCDSTWAAIGQSSTFQLLPFVENIGRGKFRHIIKVIKTGSLTGRIVNVNISCGSRSKTSCLVFKLAGQIKCPVDILSLSSTPLVTSANSLSTRTPFSDTSTKNSSTEATGPENDQNRGVTSTSSGTVAAVIIIIIFVVIIAAIVGFVIWKRKRGENVLFMDHLINIARKVRPPPSTKKVEEPEEQIYAEIPEQRTRQRVTTPSATFDREIYSFAFNDPNSAYAPPETIKTCPKMADEAPADDLGYMVPVDSPTHKDPDQHDTYNNKNPNLHGSQQEHKQPTYRGGVSNDVAPFYDILEAPDQQNTTKCHNQQQGYTHRGGEEVRSAAPGRDSTKDSNRYETKQRRRPPSPPRKI